MIKKKVRNILVPLDGSQNSIRGLDTAIYIARQCHAIIIGINVMPVSIFAAIQPADFMPAYSALESFDIINQLKKNKIDLIVIGSSGRGAAKELFFGSTSNYVIHRANVPVVVVK